MSPKLCPSPSSFYDTLSPLFPPLYLWILSSGLNAQVQRESLDVVTSKIKRAWWIFQREEHWVKWCYRILEPEMKSPKSTC